ncbi:MAG: hypothetical protein R3181_15825 [Rubricoccaceae bacterium]|nr:hypothetical protein [Rubricoccaceae bacterium]
MPWPFLIPIVAILAWALVEMSKNRQAAGGELPKALADLTDRLEAMEAERARLRQRVEHLEAIVTSEAYELEREARRALPPTSGQALSEGGQLALEEPEPMDEPMDDEARAARLARRVRGG